MDVYVNVGDCAVTTNPADVIKTFALATCVGVTAFSRRTRTAGMLHAMLPHCPDQATRMLRPFSYVDTGMELFMQQLIKTGSFKSDLVFQVYGGASSRAKEDFFQIGRRNLIEVENQLIYHRVEYHMVDVAGTVSRTLTMDALTGKVSVLSRVF